MDRDILNGMIDMHVHNGPSNAKRKLNTAEFCLEADKEGYRAFITKDHYFPSMMTAIQTNTILEKLTDGKIKTKAYGSLILNSAVGGINLKAVDAAIAMDCKYLSLPTLGSANHMAFYRGKAFPGSAGMVLGERPLTTTYDNDTLLPEVEDLLQFLAKIPNAPILATGHGTREEQNAVIVRASELGVKILVNHPYYGFDCRLDDIEQWANKYGAFIELTATVFINDDKNHAFLKGILDRVPTDKLLMDSDMGQANVDLATNGMYRFAVILHDKFGMSVDDINKISKEIPAKLMNLD